VRLNRRRHERTARCASLPTRELLVPGKNELLSHYASTIGCRFIRQWYMASAEPHSAATSDIVRARRPDRSVRGPATLISCLQMTSTRTWQRRRLPPSRRTSGSSSQRNLQLSLSLLKTGSSVHDA